MIAFNYIIGVHDDIGTWYHARCISGVGDEHAACIMMPQ